MIFSVLVPFCINLINLLLSYFPMKKKEQRENYQAIIKALNSDSLRGKFIT